MRKVRYSRSKLKLLGVPYGITSTTCFSGNDIG